MKSCPLCYSAYPNQQTNCPTDGTQLFERREPEPGTVNLAEHILLNRQRALKFISSEVQFDDPVLQSPTARRSSADIAVHERGIWVYICARGLVGTETLCGD